MAEAHTSGVQSLLKIRWKLWNTFNFAKIIHYYQ